MGGSVIHASFDVLAWIAAGAAAIWLARTGRVSFPVLNRGVTYLAALVVGAGIGAVAFGSADLWLFKFISPACGVGPIAWGGQGAERAKGAIVASSGKLVPAGARFQRNCRLPGAIF